MKHCYLEILLKKSPGPWIIIRASEILHVPRLTSVSQVKEKLHYSLDDFSRRLFVFICEKLGEGWAAYIYLKTGRGIFSRDGGTCGEEGPVNESEDREPQIWV